MSLADLSTILTTTSGRDKTGRWVQFCCKMMKWLLPMVHNDPEMIKTLGNLYGNMSMTRKVLRFGREYPTMKDFFANIPAEGLAGIGMEQFFNLLSKGAFCGYILADHMMYFQKIGLWKPDAQTLAKANVITEGLWLLETVANVILCIIRLQKLDGKTGVLADKARNDLYRALIRNLFDIPVCLHFMEWAPESIEPGLFGFCGTVSSTMSLMDMWPKSAAGNSMK